MPLTSLGYRELAELADTHLCGECQGRLNVAWVNGQYVLRCGNLNHSTITRHDEEYEKRVMEVRMTTTAIAPITEKNIMARIDMAKFPQELTASEKKLLAQVALTYGLDPLMQEITVYQGRPYVSIDGRYRKAQETGKLDGVCSRPATKEEKVEWQIPAGDFFFRAEVRVRGMNYPFVGWGRVFVAETVGGKGFKPVEKNPQRMAEKRAEAQALRKAFHINLPSLEDIGAPEGIEESAMVIESSGNTITAVSEAKTMEETLPGNGKLKRDPYTIKNFTDLCKAAATDWPKKYLSSNDVLIDLGITNKTQIGDPADAYRTLVSLNEQPPDMA